MLALVAGGCSGGGTDSPEPSSVRSSATWLEALSLDDAGWSQSRQLHDLVRAGPEGLAATDDAVVALLAGSPPVYRSTDGLTWQASEGTPMMSWAGCPPAVAGGPVGFVSVGTRDTGADDAPDTPVVAFSTDGRRWEEIEPMDLPMHEVAWLTDVFAGPDGFLVLGSAGAAEDLGGFAWFSPDGRTWTTSALADASAVAVTSDGWVAITDDPVRAGEPEVRTSRDGRTWSSVDTVSAPPRTALGAYCGTAHLAVLGDTWVLTESEGRHDVVVWVSTDAGVAWDQHTVIDVPGGGEQRVHDLAATASGLVLTGWWAEGPQGDHHTYVSQSTDGISWETASSTDTEEITRIASMGDTLVLAADDGETLVWNEPR